MATIQDTLKEPIQTKHYAFIPIDFQMRSNYHNSKEQPSYFPMTKNPQKTINRTYRIRGAGGQGACMAIQSVLQEHGLCGYTEWTTPEWHFVYLTHLEASRVITLLGDLNTRFQIQVNNGITLSQ